MGSTGIFAIHHASLLVSDKTRSLRFYQDVLGLEVDSQRPEMSFPGAWLRINDEQQIHLLELPSPDPVNGRPAHGGRDRHIALRVGDVNGLEERLTAAGVEFTRSASGRAALFCRDPDGNALEFIQA